MSEFAGRLRKLRGSEAQGVFAERLGLKQAVYCHYEKGRREPSLDQLINIVLRLDCSSDYLLGLIDEPHPLRDTPQKHEINASDNSPVAIGSNITQNISITPRKKKRS